MAIETLENDGTIGGQAFVKHPPLKHHQFGNHFKNMDASPMDRWIQLKFLGAFSGKTSIIYRIHGRDMQLGSTYPGIKVVKDISHPYQGTGNLQGEGWLPWMGEFESIH